MVCSSWNRHQVPFRSSRGSSAEDTSLTSAWARWMLVSASPTVGLVATAVRTNSCNVVGPSASAAATGIGRASRAMTSPAMAGASLIL